MAENNFDYNEALYQAIDIIVNKKIEKISFDTTIEATIIDAKKAEDGIYTVSTGAINFIATSSNTDYKEKDKVMVTIPQGDYDKQKIIVGKKVANEKESAVPHKLPFSGLVNITNNLLTNKQIISMTANSNKYAWEEDVTYFEDNNNKENLLIDSIDLTNIGSGYEKIGIKADFSTMLNEYNTMYGNYGLALILKYKIPNIKISEALNNDSFQKVINFDSKDFLGNIYNFTTYYNQEAIFDISEFKDYSLQNISLYAYQRNNFKDSDGEKIPFEIENQFGKNVEVPANIFIKNIYICLGLSTDTFKNDTAEIIINQEAENNLSLRWIHKNEETGIIKVMEQEDLPSNYEIRWCKYNPDAELNDLKIAHWEMFSSNSFAANLVTNKREERVKVFIIKNNNDEESPPTIIISTKEKIITNENGVSNEYNAIIRNENALKIEFKDNSYGKYYFYNLAGKISEKENIMRTLGFSFSENSGIVLTEGDTIKWIFPTNEKTMITPIVDGTLFSINESPNIFQKTFKNDTNIQDYFIKYTLEPNLNYTFTDNMVQLEVIVDGILYRDSVSMNFDASSDFIYKIDITWEDNKDCFCVNNEGESLIGQVNLKKGQYDIPFDNGAIFKYKLSSTDEDNKLKVEKNEDNKKFTIFKNPEVNNPFTMDELYLLEVSVQQNEQNLIAKFPISLKRQGELDNNNNKKFIVDNIEGPREIRYDTSGSIYLDINSYAINFQTLEEYDDNKPQYRSCRQGAGNPDIYGHWELVYQGDLINNIGILPTLIETYNVDYKDTNYIDSLINELNNTGGINIIYNLLLSQNVIPQEEEDDDEKRFKDLIESFSNGLKGYFPTKDKKIVDNKKYYTREQAYSHIDLGISYSFTEVENPDSSNLSQYYEYKPLSELLSLTDRSDLKNKFRKILKNEKISKEDILNLLKIKYINQWLISGFKAPRLSPPSIYYENQPLYGIKFVIDESSIGIEKNTVLWIQPIHVFRNNQPSSNLYNWNGEEIVINEGEGIIQAKGFSAGKKENGTFTGVVIGDWSSTDSREELTKNTGIYGFNQDAMCYAFKDNGNAFIGKDGIGRIEFDGEKGIIKSGLYSLEDENNKVGTLIDLTNGRIDMWGNKVNGDANLKTHISFDTGSDKNNPYFQITDIDTDKSLIYIGNNKYYLQSKDYGNDNGKGLKLDLNKGILDMYYTNINSKNKEYINYKVYLTNNQNKTFFKISRDCFSYHTLEVFKNYEEKDNKLLNYINNYYESLNDIQITINKVEVFQYNLIKDVFYVIIKNSNNYGPYISATSSEKRIDGFIAECIQRLFTGGYQSGGNNETQQLAQLWLTKFVKEFCRDENDYDYTIDYGDSPKKYPQIETSLILENEAIVNAFKNKDTYEQYEVLSFNRGETGCYNYIIENKKLKDIIFDNESFKTGFFSALCLLYVYYYHCFMLGINTSQMPISKQGQSFFDTALEKMNSIVEFLPDEIRESSNSIIICYEKKDFTNKVQEKLEELNIEYNKDLEYFIPKITENAFKYFFGCYKDETNTWKYQFENGKTYYAEENFLASLLNNSKNYYDNYRSDKIITDNLLKMLYAKEEEIKNIELNCTNIKTLLIEENFSFSAETFEIDQNIENLVYNNNNERIDLFKIEKIDNYYNISYFDWDLLELYNFLKKQVNEITDFSDIPFNWENNLINLNKTGGYLTSKNYRPTIYNKKDFRIITPIESQDEYSNYDRKGMKGLIIDLTNDKIKLGNNARIEGYQTEFYPGHTGVNHRMFAIGTGINFNNNFEFENSKQLDSEADFLYLKSGPSSNPAGLQRVFSIRWDGTLYCMNIQGSRNSALKWRKLSKIINDTNNTIIKDDCYILTK